MHRVLKKISIQYGILDIYGMSSQDNIVQREANMKRKKNEEKSFIKINDQGRIQKFWKEEGGTNQKNDPEKNKKGGHKSNFF